MMNKSWFPGTREMFKDSVMSANEAGDRGDYAGALGNAARGFAQLSGQKFNLLLSKAGMQSKEGEHWVPSQNAEGFYRVLDTGKQHNDGTMVQQIKWADHVLTLVQQAA